MMWPFDRRPVCERKGHKFEARWDYDVPESAIKGLKATPQCLEIFMRRKYVRDVCVRCGAIGQREAG